MCSSKKHLCCMQEYDFGYFQVEERGRVGFRLFINYNIHLRAQRWSIAQSGQYKHGANCCVVWEYGCPCFISLLASLYGCNGRITGTVYEFLSLSFKKHPDFLVFISTEALFVCVSSCCVINLKLLEQRQTDRQRYYFCLEKVATFWCCSLSWGICESWKGSADSHSASSYSPCSPGADTDTF